MAMKSREETVQNKKSRTRMILSEYASAAGGFMLPAWIGDVPLAVVAAVFAFLLAGCAASVLFDQLSGIRELPDKSRNTIGALQSSIIGMSIGAGSAWGHEHMDDFGMGIGITLASLVGVCLALTGTAWRQRWSERRLYRDMLANLATQPET